MEEKDEKLKKVSKNTNKKATSTTGESGSKSQATKSGLISSMSERNTKETEINPNSDVNPATGSIKPNMITNMTIKRNNTIETDSNNVSTASKSASVKNANFESARVNKTEINSETMKYENDALNYSTQKQEIASAGIGKNEYEQVENGAKKQWKGNNGRKMAFVFSAVAVAVVTFVAGFALLMKDVDALYTITYGSDYTNTVRLEEKNGETITISTPITEGDYSFLYWVKDGEIVSYDATYSFELTSKTKGDYVAVYFQSKFTVCCSSINSVSETKYSEGDIVTLTADEVEGYTFSHWEKDGTSVSEDEVFSFTASSSTAGTYSPVYTEKEGYYTITLEVDDTSITGRRLADSDLTNAISDILTKEDLASSITDSTTCGWFMDEDFTTPFTSGTLTSDITLHTKQATTRGLTYTYDEGTQTATVNANAKLSSQNVVIPQTHAGYTVTAIEGCGACNIKTITLPSTIESIGDGAFGANCFASINLSACSSLTSIGANAFRECTSLTSITLPDSVTYVGMAAFYGCTSLTQATLSKNLQTMGNAVFNMCENLETVDFAGCTSLSSLGSFVFGHCYNLKSITIPESVTNIGEEIFIECTSLTTASMSGVTNIDVYAFYKCTALEEISFSSQATSIGEGAFAYCESLTSITIPEGVTSIADHLFRGCSALTTVNGISHVTSIGSVAFYDCESLGSVDLSSAISIGNDAFRGCYSLQTVTLSENLTSIDEAAFYECERLASVSIPSGVTSIGDYTFYKCMALTSVGDISNVTAVGYAAFAGCEKLESVALSSIVTIGDFAFRGCTYLTSVTFSTSLTSIGECAFVSCTSLVSLDFSDTKLESIGTDAFYGCSGLTTVYLPSTLTTISASTASGAPFYGCSSTLTIHVDLTQTQVTALVGNGWGAYWNYYSDTKQLNVVYNG